VAEAFQGHQRFLDGVIEISPSGAHEIELAQRGTHATMRFSLGEALQARKVLDQAIADLTFEESRDRNVIHRVRKAVNV
jgi:hypothetical protein